MSKHCAKVAQCTVTHFVYKNHSTLFVFYKFSFRREWRHDVIRRDSRSSSTDSFWLQSGVSKVDISSEWRHCVLSRDFEFPLFTFWYAWLGRTPDFWATPTSAPPSLRVSHRQQMDSSDVIRHGSRWSSSDSFWLESGQAKWIYRVSDVIENYHVTGIFIFIHSLICKAWKDPRSWANAHWLRRPPPWKHSKKKFVTNLKTG